MGVASDDTRPPGRAGLGLGSDSGENMKEMRVPSNFVGLIIGKGGEQIRDLQARTGATVQVAKENLPGTNERSVTISGSVEQVREATNAIETIISDRRDGGGGMGGNRRMQHVPENGLKVPVPNDKVGLIIGKGGATIKAIQAKTGANIQIPPDPDSDDRNTRTLIVTGGEEEQKAAEEQIYQILCENEMQRNSGGKSGGGDHQVAPGEFSSLIFCFLCVLLL
jgi:far upstream element-binding protein